MPEFATQGSPIAPPSSVEDSQQEQMAAAEPVVMPASNVSTKPSALAPPPQAGALAQSVGGWVHRHKDLPQGSVLGFGAYQYVRSALASIPYGISMAVTLLGITKMGMVGDAMAAKPGAGTVTKTVGHRMSQLASFTPIRTAAMVATSFTLYRGTSKLVKWLTEYLFNPKDSEARTIEKVRDLPHETVRKIKEIAPAEVSSTPVSALVLGFVTAGFNKGGYPVINKETKHWELKGSIPSEIDWRHQPFKDAKGFGAKMGKLKDALIHPKARLMEQALIFTLGYSLFFELGDRLFKDKQIRRGVWPGDAHSTKALKATPDAYEEGIQKQKDEAETGKYAESARSEKPNHAHYGAFTQEPSITRFAFRRVLPTLAGIGAYTAFKFRNFYQVFGDFEYDKAKPLLRQAPKIALLEGAATSLFFLVPLFSEPWEKAYDNFFNKLEKKAHDKEGGTPVDPHIAENYAKLGAALDRKEALEKKAVAQR